MCSTSDGLHTLSASAPCRAIARPIEGAAMTWLEDSKRIPSSGVFGLSVTDCRSSRLRPPPALLPHSQSISSLIDCAHSQFSKLGWTQSSRTAHHSGIRERAVHMNQSSTDLLPARRDSPTRPHDHQCAFRVPLLMFVDVSCESELGRMIVHPRYKTGHGLHTLGSRLHVRCGSTTRLVGPLGSMNSGDDGGCFLGGVGVPRGIHREHERGR